MVLKIDLLRFSVRALLKLSNLKYIIGSVKICFKALRLSFAKTAWSSNFSISNLSSSTSCSIFYLNGSEALSVSVRERYKKHFIIPFCWNKLWIFSSGNQKISMTFRWNLQVKLLQIWEVFHSWIVSLILFCVFTTSNLMFFEKFRSKSIIDLTVGFHTVSSKHSSEDFITRLLCFFSLFTIAFVASICSNFIVSSYDNLASWSASSNYILSLF